MELNLIEHEKNRVKFEVKGEGHAFCNALRKELWNDSSVEIAGYSLGQSAGADPVFVLEVNRGEAKKVLLNAAERLRKKNEEIKEKLKKVL